MPKYLIDVNLPYRFSIWNSPEFTHQKDINDEWSDEQIWGYAKSNNLTIVTKDSDFASKMIFRNPPPRVVHIKFGNMKMKEFHSLTTAVWNEIAEASEKYKLVTVFKDRIEGIQ